MQRSSGTAKWLSLQYCRLKQRSLPTLRTICRVRGIRQALVHTFGVYAHWPSSQVHKAGVGGRQRKVRNCQVYPCFLQHEHCTLQQIRTPSGHPFLSMHSLIFVRQVPEQQVVRHRLTCCLPSQSQSHVQPLLAGRCAVASTGTMAVPWLESRIGQI